MGCGMAAGRVTLCTCYSISGIILKGRGPRIIQADSPPVKICSLFHLSAAEI